MTIQNIRIATSRIVLILIWLLVTSLLASPMFTEYEIDEIGSISLPSDWAALNGELLQMLHELADPSLEGSNESKAIFAKNC
jgi:hypothetical protein